MNTLITIPGLSVLLGSALIGGVIFAFSIFVMKALSRVPYSSGNDSGAYVRAGPFKGVMSDVFPAQARSSAPKAPRVRIANNPPARFSTLIARPRK